MIELSAQASSATPWIKYRLASSWPPDGALTHYLADWLVGRDLGRSRARGAKYQIVNSRANDNYGLWGAHTSRLARLLFSDLD